MELEKLKRKLEREFKRSPGKTCVLLGLVPVAIYFVGPVLWKMVPQAKKTAPTVAVAVTAAAAGQPVVALTAGSLATNWHELAERIAKDARMRVAPLEGLQDPFRAPMATEQEMAEEMAKAGIEPDVDANAGSQLVNELQKNEPRGPEDYGLRLTATVVGSRSKLATISGKAYRESAVIQVSESPTGTDAEVPAVPTETFVVKTVSQKYVVLESKAGKRYRLDLPR